MKLESSTLTQKVMWQSVKMSKYKRISQADINMIVNDLARWSRDGAKNKITWNFLEKRYGFSRQAMQAKVEIKSSYNFVKKSAVSIKKKTNEVVDSAVLIERLTLAEEQIKEYKRKEDSWRSRWQRIAFHIRQRGMQVSLIDKDIPSGGEKLSEKEVSNVLKLFDANIPSSGRV